MYTYTEKYKRIEIILNNLFDIECPLDNDKQILTTADEIFSMYKSWLDFWYKMRPSLKKQDVTLYNDNSIITTIICDEKIIAIMNQLKELDLDQEFIKLYYNKNV